MQRRELYTWRCTVEEREQLRRLAAYRKISAASLIRALIAQEDGRQKCNQALERTPPSELNVRPPAKARPRVRP